MHLITRVIFGEKFDNLKNYLKHFNKMLHHIQQIKGASTLHPLNPPEEIFSNLIGYSEKYKYRVGAPLKGRWPSHDIFLVRP